MADRRAIFEWAAMSDITQHMMGPPRFPDQMPPTWEEFCDDYVEHFFDDSAPELGRCFVIEVDGEAVGQINYNDIFEYEGRRRTELDIWLRAERFTGRGYGSDTINALVDYMAQTFNVTEFMMQPSARNPRGIRTYEKCGFVRLDVALAEAVAEWGPSDTDDSVYMVRRVER